MLSIEKTLPRYLTSMGIKISKSFCEKLLLTHPNYPSLLSVVELLERLDIPYHIARMRENELTDIPYPYLLHIENNGGTMVTISEKEDLIKYKTEPYYSSNIILLTEKNVIIRDKANTKKIHEEKFFKNSGIIISIAFLFFLSFVPYINFSLLTILQSILSIIGISVGYVLVTKDLGIKYETVERFCNISTQDNCDKILNSDGATIFGQLKLTDLVVGYFVSQLILLLTTTYYQEKYLLINFILSIWSFLGIPIILFSIYYQARIIKSWCKLCLVINAVLFIQAIIYLIFIYKKTIIPKLINSLYFVIISSILFILFVLITYMIRTLIKESRIFKKESLVSARIKNDPVVINYLLSREITVDTSEFFQEVRLGNKDAPIQIIMASNLYCKPCKEQHAVITKLITQYPSKVSVRFRFVLSGADFNNSPTSVQYLINYWQENIFETENESNKTEEMMDIWFSYMNLDKFMHSMPLKSKANTKLAEELAAKHYVWVSKADVKRTPTFYINSSLLPAAYFLEDLESTILGLAEILEHNSLAEPI